MADNTLAKKRMLKVSFTGRELLEGKVFDTTSESVAKANGSFDPKRKYLPLAIILGEKELLPLVEAELEKMKEGEEKKIILSPRDAFGERNADAVRVVPMKVFIDQKINPIPGLVISTGEMYGRVQSVGGGRVRVDFNHPLAGRDIEYLIKIEKEVTDKNELANELYDKYYGLVPGISKEMKAGALCVKVPSKFYKTLEKVNESVSRLAKELGVSVEFKEDKEAGAKDSSAPKEGHVHGPNCNHPHEDDSEEEPKDEVETLNEIEDELDTVEGVKEALEKDKANAKIAAEVSRMTSEVSKQRTVPIEAKKSFGKVMQDIAKEKKGSGVSVETIKDSSTTIQRPAAKKK